MAIVFLYFFNFIPFLLLAFFVLILLYLSRTCTFFFADISGRNFLSSFGHYFLSRTFFPGGGSPGMNSLSISVTQTVDICSATSPQESVSLPTSTASTKWCVVDGILKQDDEKMWRQVKLKGGCPVVPNRFGKYIEFNLTPCKKEVPQPYQDNFICGTCVRKNENLQKIDKTMISSREGHQNFCGMLQLDIFVCKPY